MKKSLVFVCLIALMGIMNVQSYAYEKIGFFEMKEVILKSERGKQAAQELKKLYDEKKAIIQHTEKDLRERKNYLEKNTSVLSSAEKMKLESDYQKKFKDYQDLVDGANKELKKRDEEIASYKTPRKLDR